MPAHAKVVKHFSGRGQLLSEIARHLSPQLESEVRICALVGLGGIGKTQLATKFVEQCGKQFGIIAWLRAAEESTLRQEFVRLGTLLGITDSDESETQSVERTRDHLARETRPWLLVLDNVEDGQAVLGVMPSRGNGAILLTSRLQQLRSEFGGLQIDALTTADCVEYLLAAAGSEDREGAHTLALAVGGLPLALAHASAYVEEHRISFQRYVETLRELPARDLLFQNPSLFYDGALASTWQRSIEAASDKWPQASGLLDRLSFLDPDGIPRELADGPLTAGALGVQEIDLRHAAGALGRYSLIQLNETEIHVHRMVQKVGRDDVKHRGEQASVASSLIGIFDAALADGTGEDDWPRSLRLRPHLLQLLYWVRSEKKTMDASVVKASQALVVTALWHGIQSAAMSAINVVNKTPNVLASLRQLRKMSPGADVGRGDLGVLLRVCLGEVPDDQAAQDADRRLVQRGRDQEIACVLYLAVHGSRADVRVLKLAVSERVHQVLERHPTWTGSVRFACAVARPDLIMVNVLESAVSLGDAMATGRWLSALDGLGSKETERRLRRQARSHEHVTLALATRLARYSRTDRTGEAVQVLRAGLDLGPQVPLQLSALLLRTGARSEAIEVLRRHSELLPQAATRLAALLVEDDDAAGAEAVLRGFSGKDRTATLSLARLLIKEGRHEDAEAALAKPARVWPEAALQLHRLQLRREDLSGAIETLKRHLEDPKVRRVANRLVSRIPTGAAEFAQLVSQFDADAAQSRFAKKQQKKHVVPVSREVLAKARVRLEEGEWEQAIQVLCPSANLASPTELAGAVVKAAQLFKSGGDHRETVLLEHFAPTIPNAALALARARTKAGHHEDALAVVEPYLNEAEADPQLASQISRVQQEAGRPDLALTTLAAVVEPTTEVLLRRADLHSGLNEPEAALRLLVPHLTHKEVSARFLRICGKHRAHEFARGVLAEMDDSATAGKMLQNLASGSPDDAIRRADMEWFHGDRERAVNLLADVESPSQKMISRLIEYCGALGDLDAVHEHTERLMPSTPWVAIHAAEIFAEVVDVKRAERLLQSKAPSSIDAALGLSRMAWRTGDEARAEGYIAMYQRQDLLAPIAVLMARDPKRVGTALLLAQELNELGHPGYAEDLLTPHQNHRVARVQLAELLRIRLAFEECRELLTDLAPHYVPATCGMATAWLRNGRPDEASRTLEDYRGPNSARFNDLAKYLAVAHTRAGSAVTVARAFLEFDQPRSAFEVLQVTANQNDSRVKAMYGMRDMRPSGAVVNAIGRVRLRAYLRDRARKIKVWPDFRTSLQQQSNKQRVMAITKAMRERPNGPG